MTDISNERLDCLRAQLERIYQNSKSSDLATNRNQEVLSKLTLNLVLDWARLLSPDTIVGKTVSLSNCPIYCYLRDAGFPVSSVSPNVITGKGFSLQRGEFPLSISKLICKIDERGNGARQAVTASELVSLIEAVMARVQP